MLKDLLIYLSTFQNLITNSNTVKRNLKKIIISQKQRWINERLHREHRSCATFLTTNFGTVKIQYRIYKWVYILNVSKCNIL